MIASQPWGLLEAKESPIEGSTRTLFACKKNGYEPQKEYNSSEVNCEKQQEGVSWIKGTLSVSF